MNYKVWQAINPSFGFGSKPKFPEAYELVAVVKTNDLDDVFRITNHIDSDWTENPEVVELIKSRCRSTSVGDVVEDENGILMYCAPIGWEQIPNVDNDEFQCDECKQIFDIEDSIKLGDKYVCSDCEEKIINKRNCRLCGTFYDSNDGHSCMEMRGGLDE